MSEIWIVRFSVEVGQDSFLLFSDFGALLTAVHNAVWERDTDCDPYWSVTSWRVFYVNLQSGIGGVVRDVTNMVTMESFTHCPPSKEKEW